MLARPSGLSNLGEAADSRQQKALTNDLIVSINRICKLLSSASARGRLRQARYTSWTRAANTQEPCSCQNVQESHAYGTAVVVVDKAIAVLYLQRDGALPGFRKRSQA